MLWVKAAAAWVVAALLAATAASVASTQSVLGSLIEVGARITTQDRLSMTVADLAILQTLFPVMAVCFLVAFIIAALCVRFVGGLRAVWFIAAGASSIVCTLLLMSWLMNLMPVAGARSTLGMLMIAACGGLGGYVFAKLTQAENAAAP